MPTDALMHINPAKNRSVDCPPTKQKRWAQIERHSRRSRHLRKMPYDPRLIGDGNAHERDDQ